MRPRSARFPGYPCRMAGAGCAARWPPGSTATSKCAPRISRYAASASMTPVRTRQSSPFRAADVNPCPLLPRLHPFLRELNPLCPLQSPHRKARSSRRGGERAPLDLERVVVFVAAGDLRPVFEVVDRAGNVGIPYRPWRRFVWLYHAVAGVPRRRTPSSRPPGASGGRPGARGQSTTN